MPRERLSSTAGRSGRMRAASVGTLLTLSLVLTPAAAYQMYKTVDAAGNVSYSSHPPADSVSMEVVKIRSGPSAESQAEAAQRESEIEQAAGEIQQQREALEAERARSVSAARAKVSAAKTDLEAAREIRDDDRQGTVSGKRRLKPSYHERVQSAEQRYDAARANLRSAMKGQN